MGHWCSSVGKAGGGTRSASGLIGRKMRHSQARRDDKQVRSLHVVELAVCVRVLSDVACAQCCKSRRVQPSVLCSAYVGDLLGKGKKM